MLEKNLTSKEGFINKKNSNPLSETKVRFFILTEQDRIFKR